MEGRDIYPIRSRLETIGTYARQTRAERPLQERLQDRERWKESVNATASGSGGAIPRRTQKNGHSRRARATGSRGSGVPRDASTSGRWT